MSEVDWDNPTARLALIERVGPDEYNRLLEAHQSASTVSTVNGYAIRPVQSRFGRLFSVAGTRMAFATLAEAEAYARKQEPRT